MTAEDDPKFEALLDHIQRSRGFDLTGYKRPSLMRRILKRVQAVGLGGFAEYMDYLEVRPEEFTELFNTILINVTEFFRDESAWDCLGQEIIPRILQSKGSGESLRVWSAGCASGEETFTLAMLLAEALGADAFHQRVKIYATDVDEDALNQARQARYSESQLQSVPAELREKYFEPAGGYWAFRADLRRSVIFGRHDLVQDAPISRLDLLVCRNTLMYLNSETQTRILARFHFALNDAGYLFLGKAEMLLTHHNVFAPIDLKHRIFMKAQTVNMRGRLLVPERAGDGAAVNQRGPQSRLREVAFDAGPVVQVVVDLNGNLAMANERARALFSLTSKDVGRPLQDLELSYRPAELRSLIEQAYAERRVVTLTNVERRFPDEEVQYFDVQVTPMQENGGNSLGASITFDDVTHRQRLQLELQRSTQELETTNEELQSTNEELETTNEELQSTNEELETTNEELHSTNEELETMNTELHKRTNDLGTTNAFLRSILASLRAGVAVVDRQLNVLVWNHRAEDLWGLRADEVQGQSLLTLGTGLPVEQLPVSAFLAGEASHQEVTVHATNRRGTAIDCLITCTPFLGVGGEREGVVLLMEEVER